MEQPIIFNDAMIRAVLDERKTQTRRVITPQPSTDQGDPIYTKPRGIDGLWHWFYADSSIYKCPYGVPGDRLWVREAWQHEDQDCDNPKCGNPDHIYYRATECAICRSSRRKAWWRPSIHMPRWASRITLQIVDVRAERLQEITGEDAITEGWDRVDLFPGINSEDKAKVWFHSFWDSINAKRGYGWDTDPWVWVIEFRKLD